MYFLAVRKQCGYILSLRCGFGRTSEQKEISMTGVIEFKQGETDMGDKGSKDKGKKENKKKAQRTPKEKRKAKEEKKKNK